jgi:hypothetical protein
MGNRWQISSLENPLLSEFRAQPNDSACPACRVTRCEDRLKILNLFARQVLAANGIEDAAQNPRAIGVIESRHVRSRTKNSEVDDLFSQDMEFFPGPVATISPGHLVMGEARARSTHVSRTHFQRADGSIYLDRIDYHVVILDRDTAGIWTVSSHQSWPSSQVRRNEILFTELSKKARISSCEHRKLWTDELSIKLNALEDWQNVLQLIQQQTTCNASKAVIAEPVQVQTQGDIGVAAYYCFFFELSEGASMALRRTTLHRIVVERDREGSWETIEEKIFGHESPSGRIAGK